MFVFQKMTQDATERSGVLVCLRIMRLLGMWNSDQLLLGKHFCSNIKQFYCWKKNIILHIYIIYIYCYLILCFFVKN